MSKNIEILFRQLELNSYLYKRDFLVELFYQHLEVLREGNVNIEKIDKYAYIDDVKTGVFCASKNQSLILGAYPVEFQYRLAPTGNSFSETDKSVLYVTPLNKEDDSYYELLRNNLEMSTDKSLWLVFEFSNGLDLLNEKNKEILENIEKINLELEQFFGKNAISINVDNLKQKIDFYENNVSYKNIKGLKKKYSDFINNHNLGKLTEKEEQIIKFLKPVENDISMNVKCVIDEILINKVKVDLTYVCINKLIHNKVCNLDEYKGLRLLRLMEKVEDEEKIDSKKNKVKI